MNEYFYFNTSDPFAEPRPLHNSLAYVNERVVRDKAERNEHLIIFISSRDEINAAHRLGRPVTYEQYLEDMEKQDGQRRDLGEFYLQHRGRLERRGQG